MCIRDSDTYIRSAIMLLIKAISDIAGSPRAGKVSVEFSIGRGYYCIPRGELAEKVICADGEEDGQIEAGFVEPVSYTHLEGVYHITSMICEIPSGAAADLLGRKRTVVWGRLCTAKMCIRDR